MPRAGFTQGAITRAVKAVEAAGVVVGRVEIELQGKLTIFAKDDEGSGKLINDWDKP